MHVWTPFVGCRLVWESGIACIAVASVCSSLGALCVKVLNGRVPVFEIVVSPVVSGRTCDTASRLG